VADGGAHSRAYCCIICTCCHVRYGWSLDPPAVVAVDVVLVGPLATGTAAAAEVALAGLRPAPPPPPPRPPRLSEFFGARGSRGACERRGGFASAVPGAPVAVAVAVGTACARDLGVRLVGAACTADGVSNTCLPSSGDEGWPPRPRPRELPRPLAAPDASRSERRRAAPLNGSTPPVALPPRCDGYGERLGLPAAMGERCLVRCGAARVERFTT